MPLAAEDWPRWRGVRGNGTWTAPALPEEWPEAGLPVVWKQPIGGGYGGPAVVGDRLYVMDRQKEPEDVERIRCLNAGTGEPLWEVRYPVNYADVDYGNGPRVTPTVHEGRVYTLGAVGHLHCLDADSGKIFWKKDLVAEQGAKIPMWGLAASPVLFENLVIVHAGVKDGGCFQAFDRQSGEEVWRSGDDPAGYCTPILIDSPSGKQLVGWTPLNVVGIDPHNGTLHWKIPYKVTYGVSIATPIYDSGIVLVAGYWEGTKAIRLGANPGEAELIWEENRELRGLMSQPLVREGYVYLLDKQYGLTCFELATGKKLWDDKNQLTPRGRNPQANLVWLDFPRSDRIVALNADGDLILARITPEGYQEQSRTNIIGPTWAHPAFAGNRVYARNDEEIVCVQLPVVNRADRDGAN